MGLIRAEISMSQPANVVYTHKKFKRTSSSSQPPWAAAGGGAAGDDQQSSLSGGASNGGGSTEHHGGGDAMGREHEAAYTRHHTPPEAQLPGHYSEGCPAPGSPRRPTNGLCEAPRSQQEAGGTRLRCSYCQVICDNERSLQEHVLSHLLCAAACGRCGSRDNPCSCRDNLKSQLLHFPSADLNNTSVNSNRSSPSNCSFVDKYPQPADLSVHSTNNSNNHAYPTTTSQHGDNPSSNASSESAALKSIYKPKFRASYSLDESSLLESAVSGLFPGRLSETLIDGTSSSDATRRNASSSTYHANSSNCSLQSPKKTSAVTRTGPPGPVATSSTKQEDSSTARGIGGLVGAGLWKDIKSPSPDIGEHIDKIIVQNQVIMDSDNPLWTRKYRRQSSIGSSSSESDGSSAPRNRRCSVTDSSGKSKPPSSLQLGLLSHQNRFRNAFPGDGTPAAVPPPMHPTDLMASSPSVSALKRSLSCTGPPAPVAPSYRPAAPFLPSSALLETHKRNLTSDGIATLTPSSGAPGPTEHDLLRQHLLSMPDSEANKVLLARGHALALQGTSIVPVTNAAALLLVCPNCSASFRNRESLQLHIERHCDAGIRSHNNQVNYSYRVQIADQQARTVSTKPDPEQQEVALDLIKKVHAVSDDSHTYLRGSSLGAEVRLNADQARFNSQHVRIHKSMSPFTRQSSLEPAIPPNKKRRLSSDPPGGDTSKSVHPVYLHNGVVFQKANVSVKTVVEETKKPVGKHQMYGGEVKICDGAEYKTMKIDTSEGSRSLALDMCLTAPPQDALKLRMESPIPTSLVVTLSKSGLICGGTVVESRVSMSKAAPTNLVYSRPSSDHYSLHETSAATASHSSEEGHSMSRDTSEGIMSSLQRYAPQLQLPNLSIPGVPIPNIGGVILPKLITNPSALQPNRLLTGNDSQITTAFCLDSSSSLPSKIKTPTTDQVTPSIISLSRDKVVPYVPGIPGPYSQASSNLMHASTSITKCSSPVVVNTPPVLLTSAVRKPTTFPPLHMDTSHLPRHSPARRTESTVSEKPLSSPSPNMTLVHSVPEHNTSVDVPAISPVVTIASDKIPFKQAATEAKIVSVPNVPAAIALSLEDAPKDTFLMPRKRPDTLPLKPHQFTSKSSALLVGSTIMSPDTPRPKKSCAQLLLNGSAYTYLGLKVSTKTYYCCIHRPQPMYVPHTPDSKISMYSNWERKPAAENPFNLTISESMALYTSGSCTDRAYTVAKPNSLEYLIACSDDKLKAAMEDLKRQERKSLESSLPTDEASSFLPENSTVKCEANSGKDSVSISSSGAVVSIKDGSSGRTTKRIKIFDGGFKSTEEYTYVRGRGRGRYVCETCGIRCKKPSMLKKHIRSHTNLRPYPCHHCTSRFKTKGNLTKHLKSKAHYKRCMQLGVPPDPPPSSHDDAMDCDEDDGDDEDDDDDDDVDDDDDDDDDECDDDLRDSSSRERSRARSDSREPRRHDTRESSRESSADEMPGSSSSSSCSSSSERAAEQSYPLAVDVLAPTSLSSTVLAADDTLMAPVDLSTSHKGPASSALTDDAPMDLSVRKEAIHVTLASPKASAVTCTFTSLAMVSRPTFLPLIPSPRTSNLPSPLTLRSPMTPIREQPADILSPVTESSMLLKSIYNTTEKATKATTALHVNSQHSQAWLTKEKSGVMMTAYLTERAIQDTFIKRHQFQGAVSTSAAFVEKSNKVTRPPTTALPAATAPLRHSLLSSSSVPAALMGMTSTLSDSKSMPFQSINSEKSVQSPCSLKLKKYYCGKWENSEAPASTPLVATLATSNGSSISTALSGAQLLKVPLSSTVTLSSTSSPFPKEEPKDEPVKCGVNIHGNSALTVVQMNSSTIPKGILLVPSDGKFLPNSNSVTSSVQASDSPPRPPLTEDKVIPSAPTTHKLNNNNNNNSVDKYSLETSTQGVNVLPTPAVLPVTSTTSTEPFLTRSVPKMTLIKTSSGTIIAVSSVQSHTVHSLKQSPSRSLLSQPSCPMDLPKLSVHGGPSSTESSSPLTVTPSVAPATPSSNSLPSCVTKVNVSCATSTAFLNNKALDAITSLAVSSVHFNKQTFTGSSSLTKTLATTSSKSTTDLTKVADSLMSVTFASQSSPNSGVLASAGASSNSLSKLNATTKTVTASLASATLLPSSSSVTITLAKAPVKQSVVVTMAPGLSASSPGPSAASRSSAVTTAPSSAVNLTVLNRGDAKNGASFLSPSGVVPSSSSTRPAPEDGRCRCCVCHKEFARSSQLTLHMNIHYMERPFRCVTCAVSFRTSGHLQKHKRSASHFNKVNMNLTFGAASTTNPRPFKCHDCKVAFRIHGHLAKHLRSKMHILKLECLGKLPFGVYAEMERTGHTLANIDTSDCENSLISLQALANQLFAKEPGKLLEWQNGTLEPPPSPSEGGGEDMDQPSRTRTISNSSTNSDDYPLADDQDDPPAGDSGDEGLCSLAATSRPVAEATPPLAPSSHTPQRSSSSSPAAHSSFVNSVRCSSSSSNNNNIYKPVIVPQPTLTNQSRSSTPQPTTAAASSGPLQQSIGCTSTTASGTTTHPSSAAICTLSSPGVSRALITPTSSSYFIPSSPCVLATSIARSTSSAHLLTVSSVRQGRQAAEDAATGAPEPPPTR